MWTPKRILILLGGLVLFLAGYMVYSYFLGGINGLSVLAEEYLPTEKGPLEPPQQGDESETVTKMKRAFGNECPELKRPIKLDLRQKRVLLAADLFDIDKADGRVVLSPFSVALFAADKGDGSFPEINTIQCDRAYLTLDQKVSNLAELSNRKIIGVELIGKPNILMINNNHTPDKSDDIEVNITNGSLYYEERKNLIWTDGYVRLLDLKTQPHPTQITAKGMELKLTEGSSPNRPAAVAPTPKGKEDKVSGVEMLILKNNVDMHLYLDSNSGFLSSPADADKDKQAASRGEVPEKSHVIIKTGGPFHYDLVKELAWFDSPAAGEPTLPSSPNKVEVTLANTSWADVAAKNTIRLIAITWNCNSGKKAATAAEPKGRAHSRTSDKEIETALATARGRDLTLTMDTEKIEAYGAELHYRGPTPATGPQTLLKGSKDTPMRAFKEGHKIEALLPSCT